jgi:hypothetical protein
MQIACGALSNRPKPFCDPALRVFLQSIAAPLGDAHSPLLGTRNRIANLPQYRPIYIFEFLVGVASCVRYDGLLGPY